MLEYLYSSRAGTSRADDLKLPLGFDAQNAPAPAGDVAHHLAQAIFRDADFDVVDRLQQAGARFMNASLKAK